MARMPMPWVCRYRIVVHASTLSTSSSSWTLATRPRMPERLGPLYRGKWVPIRVKSTAGADQRPAAVARGLPDAPGAIPAGSGLARGSRRGDLHVLQLPCGASAADLVEQP